MQMLQRLHDDLRAAYPPKRRPSGLTVVDNIETESAQSRGNGGWCGTRNFAHMLLHYPHYGVHQMSCAHACW